MMKREGRRERPQAKDEGRRTYAVVNLIGYFPSAMKEGDPKGFRKMFCSEQYRKCFHKYYDDGTEFELKHAVLAEGLTLDDACRIQSELWGTTEDGTLEVVDEPFDPDECYRSMVEGFRELAQIRKEWEEAV